MGLTPLEGCALATYASSLLLANTRVLQPAEAALRAAPCMHITQENLIGSLLRQRHIHSLVMGTRCGDIDPAIVPYLQASSQLPACLQGIPAICAPGSGRMHEDARGAGVPPCAPPPLCLLTLTGARRPERCRGGPTHEQAERLPGHDRYRAAALTARCTACMCCRGDELSDSAHSQPACVPAQTASFPFCAVAPTNQPTRRQHRRAERGGVRPEGLRPRLPAGPGGGCASTGRSMLASVGMRAAAGVGALRFQPVGLHLYCTALYRRCTCGGSASTWALIWSL